MAKTSSAPDCGSWEPSQVHEGGGGQKQPRVHIGYRLNDVMNYSAVLVPLFISKETIPGQHFSSHFSHEKT
jgi:hypothetical protein